MAGTRKSAKRTARKKGSKTKRGSARKAVAKKSASKRATKRGTKRVTSSGGSRSKKTRRRASLRRQAAKGLRAARGGIDTVRQVGDKAWETLKSTTAQVVEGVKDTLSREDDNYREGSPYR